MGKRDICAIQGHRTDPVDYVNSILIKPLGLIISQFFQKPIKQVSIQIHALKPSEGNAA